MSARVIDQDIGFDDFFDKVDELQRKDAYVGYESSGGGGIGVADLAIIHEFGVKIQVTEKMRGYLATQGLFLKKSTKVISIPARPFVRESFDSSEKDLGDFGVKLADQFLNDKIDVDTLLEAWGDFYKTEMQNGVVTRKLGLEPNHPFTIERKGSETPLINTSEMINRATVQVK